MKTTLILPSFKRAELLNLGLKSIARQTILNDLEIIVVNDGTEDDTKTVCKSFKKQLNIKYLFTGTRNKEELIWRVPGFAINIAVKESNSDIIILSCPEIFHLENTIDKIIEPLLTNEFIVSTVEKVLFDQTSQIKNYLIDTDQDVIPEDIIKTALNNEHSVYAAGLPFFIGFHRKHFIEMRGYDEDFSGYAGEDDDLKARFLTKGLLYYFNKETKVIHLYHPKEKEPINLINNPAWIHNSILYQTRLGLIKRNQRTNWGDSK
jgi:glycosyltransferase involved in cell wall biosynthesis